MPINTIMNQFESFPPIKASSWFKPGGSEPNSQAQAKNPSNKIREKSRWEGFSLKLLKIFVLEVDDLPVIFFPYR